MCKKINEKQSGRFGFSTSPDVPALTLPAALHSASWATASGKNTIERLFTEAKVEFTM